MNKKINLVCSDCGIKKCTEKGIEPFECSTFHINKCDVCGEEKSVTEHRDYGYCFEE